MTHGRWTEIGERVFVGRYRFYDQDIGAILTDDGPVVIDTRSTAGQAQEILDDLRSITPLAVAAVVDTHHHYDHAFGNALFRPAPIWGHVRCAAFLREQATAYREQIAAEELPDLAAPATSSRTAPRRISGTASRSTGRRPSGRCDRWPRVPSSLATATWGISRSWNGRSPRSAPLRSSPAGRWPES